LKKRCEGWSSQGTQVLEMKRWCEEQIMWLRHTMEEMVVYDNVKDRRQIV
jgi:hypothetical protein